jgi:hypothetical protein
VARKWMTKDALHPAENCALSRVRGRQLIRYFWKIEKPWAAHGHSTIKKYSKMNFQKKADFYKKTLFLKF